MGKVLIVDDNEDIRVVLSDVVGQEGYLPLTAETGREALALLASNVIDLVFLDIGLPDVSGIELIPAIRDLGGEAGVVMLTSDTDPRSAVSCLKAGATDYILKPFDLLEFRQCLNRLMAVRLSLRQARMDTSTGGSHLLLGQCRQMKRLQEDINTAASVNAPVLITGETGTGKELVARALHARRGYGAGVFVKVDCGTLAPSVIEAELFGHEKGAFTGAEGVRNGLVSLADGGTLFLDEICNLPLELQPKLLRLLEEYTFRRVGGVRDIRVNLRVVAATNEDVEELCRQGRFREDLYYRLDVVRFRVPPLRERGDDIALLADHFLRFFAAEMKKKVVGFTADTEQLLLEHDWPGNVRELRNFVERSVIYSRGPRVAPMGIRHADPTTVSLAPDTGFISLKEMEKRYIQQVLSANGNNKSLTARILNISRTTLREKLRN